MKVDYNTAMEVASHEALVRQTYRDSVGVATWCVGMTAATGHAVDRYVGRPAPLQHCMNVYAWALENYADHVREVLPGVPRHVFAGALSFTWNLGGGSLRKAAWVKHYKAGRMESAEKAFKLWNKAGGKVSAGLVARRAKEADLIFSGKWSNDGTMTEYTRLTKSGTPVWSSAVKINVAKELKAAFVTPANVAVDKPKEPDAVVVAPTASPNHSPNALLVFALVAGVIAAGAWVWRRITGRKEQAT